MKKAPSIGFIYLVSVIICSCIFLYWVAQEGWYDRINSSDETEADLASWADYLEGISNDFTDPKKQEEVLLKSSKLRSRINQPKEALRVLEKALYLNPKSPELNALLLPLYFDTGQMKKAKAIAKDNFVKGIRDEITITVLLESHAYQSDADLTLKLIQAIRETDSPKKNMLCDNCKVFGFGLTADRWTFNGKPCFLVVSDKKLKLKLDCYANPEYMPITATVEDQSGKMLFSHIFRSHGSVRIELPSIPAGESRIFVIKTDKFWFPPNNDKRKLGVRVTSI